VNGCRSRRASCKTSAKRTSKPTCIYESRRRLESCSRDPIGYDGSKWNLFEFVNGQPLLSLDSTGKAPFAGFLECCKRTYTAEGWTALCFGTGFACAYVCYYNPPLCLQCAAAAGIILPPSCSEMVAAWEHACAGGCVPGC